LMLDHPLKMLTIAFCEVLQIRDVIFHSFHCHISEEEELTWRLVGTASRAFH
jgi:hypothetical protein